MPDTCYLEIVATQEPFPFAVDENERTMFSSNFNALTDGPAPQWAEDILRLLIDAGVAIVYTFPDGAPGDNAFVGPAAVVAKGSGPFLSVIDTGGTAPMETHNGDKQRRPSAQLVVRGRSYNDARQLALDAWDALDGVRNTTVTSP